MKKNLTIAFTFLIVSVTFSQDYKFGKVSKEELQETSNMHDKDANATVLYKKQDIYFNYSSDKGFYQINEIHERVKIYNKEGFDWATKKVRLYNRSNSSSEDLNSLKGYTYNFEGGKIVKDKLKKDGQFEEVANKYWKYNSFTMPNIKEGCVIEYTYKIVSPYSQIDDVNFQYTIPIKRFEFKVRTPEYYGYNKLLNPRASFIPKLKLSQQNNSVTLRTKSRTGTVTTKTNISEDKIDYKENVIASTEINIPALKAEPFVDNLNNYRGKLILELIMTNFPNSPLKNYATDWDKVTKSIYDSPSFGEQLEKKNYYKDDLNALLASISDPSKKIQLVYDFVKSKVKWNEFNGYRTNDGVKKAYKEGVGNTAEINLMLTAMLRSAGIKANPVLISTKSNGVPIIPTRTGFNYVITVIEGANNIYLDATDKFCNMNVLPVKVLNWQGRVIREDGSSDWVELMPRKGSKEITSLNVKINDDGSAIGKVRSQFTDYQAMRYRNRYENVSSEDHIKSIEKDKGEIEVSNLEIKNEEDVNKPIVSSYEYELFDAVEEIGGKLYFSPLLFLANVESPFKQETRSYPIDFRFPIKDKYMVNIMMPEGYEVDTLPKNEAFTFNETAGKYTYLIKQNGKYLQLSVMFDLNSSFIISSDYEYFRNFYKLLTDKQAEKIVLRKTQP